MIRTGLPVAALPCPEMAIPSTGHNLQRNLPYDQSRKLSISNKNVASSHNFNVFIKFDDQDFVTRESLEIVNKNAREFLQITQRFQAIDNR
jgi:hypothetical protein